MAAATVLGSVAIVTSGLASLPAHPGARPSGAGHGRSSAVPAVELQHVPVAPPMIRAGSAPSSGKAVSNSVDSLNWGGYAASGQAGSFTSAQASFIVPALQSCGLDEDSASSFWAGIDGLTPETTPTVEQDGVDATCSDGAAQYFAWYEVYPAPPVVFPQVAVRPGDSVQATVIYQRSGRYQLRLVDSTTGAVGSVVAPLAGASDSSAECIAEDPGTTPVPYADYGSVAFSSCTANGAPIGTLGPSKITTVAANGTSAAVPGALQSNTAFPVTRLAAASTVASTPAPSPGPAPLPGPVVGMASTPSGDGYWLADASGGVSAHGGAKLYGSMAGTRLNSPIAHIVSTSDGLGYWLVAGDGGIFSFGDARFYGSMGGHRLNAPVVDMAPTADDGGYWLVASDGGIFAFGDAPFRGSMGGRRLNAPVVGITADTATGGYWEAASDGGVFSFDAPFRGSTGSLRLDAPIVSMAAASGTGYWFVATDGGVFAFGAPFHGSGGGQAIAAPIVGMAADSATGGYWLVGRGGAVYSFGAPFYGAD
jgi:hypothetical protein